MVQVLDAVPGFGSQLGRQLGQNVGTGISTALEFGAKLQGKKAIRKKFGDEIANLPPEAQNEFIKQFSKAEAQEAMMNRMFGGNKGGSSGDMGKKLAMDGSSEGQLPDQGQDQGIDFANMSPEDRLKLSMINPNLGRHALEEKKLRTKIETRDDPKLEKLEDKLEAYEMTGMRFNRLNELFSPELESKFPPSSLVGLFSKNGELNDKAFSVLSPEAQEATKLIADELSGAKETFGARVTNFDLQAYLKRLPTLLNSAEGRRRVLRDLQIINQLNRDQAKGVIDIMEREGKSGKVSFAAAKRMYRKENEEKIKNLRNEFINPEKSGISSLDSDSARRYPGRKVKDPQTGQIFISKNNEWVEE